MIDGTGIIILNLLIIVIADVYMTKTVFSKRRDLFSWLIAYYVHTIGRVVALIHNLFPNMNIYEMNVIFSGLAVLIFIFSSITGYLRAYNIKLLNKKEKTKYNGLIPLIGSYFLFSVRLNVRFEALGQFFISILMELIISLMLIVAIWSLYRIYQKEKSPTYKFFIYTLVVGQLNLIFTVLAEFQILYAFEIMLSLDLMLNLFLLIVPIIISIEEEILIQQKKMKVQNVILQNEQMRNQKLESLGLLAGGIAHDFNNYLTSILGNTSLLKMDLNETNEEFELVAEIENATNRASELTKRLLTFSKGEAPIKNINCMEELIKESTNFTVRGTSILAEYELDPDLLPVYVDAGQISQVIQNIVLNAIQAVEKGSIIVITAENCEMFPHNTFGLQAGVYVKVSITDQGAGIPRSNLQKIFDPYFTTKANGTGLGLSVCYSIIKKHEGIIAVESELGSGTTFTIYLKAYTDLPSK